MATSERRASLRGEAATIKTTFDEAEAAVGAATARVAALKRESEQGLPMTFEPTRFDEPE
jgi:hypothetical protein